MIIDLSLPLHPSKPVFPGDPATEFSQFKSFSCNGYAAHQVRMTCHAGTHVDAPLHAVPNGGSIDEPFILEACVGESLLIPVELEEGTEILPGHLAGLDKVPPGSRLVLRTGWSSRYGEDGYYHNHPSVSRSLADWLIEREIRLIGLDTPSVHWEDDPCHDLHHRLLDAGVIILENLANLDRIPPGRFFLSASPLKLEGLDGSPTRAYAIIDE